MSNVQHVPMRMCAVTRERLPKKDLLRFVLTSEGNVELDKGERLRGRGLNMKPDITVFELGVKRKVFERVLKFKPDNEKLNKLREDVVEYIDQKFRIKQVVRVSSEQLDKLSKK